MENWLYKCSTCSTAQFCSVDKGEIWYTKCGGCDSLAFQHKVTIHIIGLRDERAQFNCVMDDVEEEDGNTSESTKKER